jgi:RNA polymerase primary sigma factor
MTSLLANKPDFTTEEDMRQFMEEVRSIPLLTAQEEKDLACRSAVGDEEAIRQLVNSNLRLVVAIARRYYTGAVPLLDLIQEGAIGLLTAARRFDYTRDVRFSTYATKWIRQGVLRCADSGNPIRMPAHMADMLRRVSEAQTELRTELGAEPQLQQIADLCHLSVDKVEQLLQLQPKTCSLDASIGEEDMEIPVEKLHGHEPHQQLVREELIRTLEQLMSKLTPRQRHILRLRNGMEDGKCHSLSGIAEMLGISKERVRQVEKQAMDKLRTWGSDVGLEDFLE